MKRSLSRWRRFDQARSIAELAEIARRRLPNFVYEYIHGGSDDEVTLANNRAVFDRYRFTPRTLTDVSHRDLGCTLFGRRVAMPIVIGPTGFNGMVTKNGDTKLARAAAGRGIPFTLSNVSTVPLEEIATTPGGWQWMQIYFYRDRDYVEQLVSRCRESGYDTIVVTTDSAIYGNREWDARNYARPFVLNWRNKLHTLSRPRWIRDVLYPEGIPTFKNLGDLLPPEDASVKGAAAEIGKHLMPSLSWEDIRWLRDRWSGNLVIKGILSVEEARTAVEYGIDGIVLSNHGGRQLDSSVSPVEILREVREAVGDRLTLLLDGGFRRGSDILKARLLGADAVLLGRTTLYGLGAGGEAGVDHALGLLQGELDRTLGLLGCSTLDELDDALMRYTGG
ncbi:alpha-hydroxy acid oxidase [Kushneria phosphatilytica]|uniref:Alpha-hydroxy-acid oxidizing protein n=1 Tax=Kushneria phosphatilytica TaxID=657387 RepID=A0A1S1NL58_9GAMM|nr:alpha-hydroxy acid oxidase [Kushneria phosphatilytica]OHV07496.1 alpha-hydroxy-acid oxidizing enzyme [Kushneria phosphatilytica]QEL09976.1 alpha-hydroxy-acid oxidizing protein [Kushneria phosphatilytica]